MPTKLETILDYLVEALNDALTPPAVATRDDGLSADLQLDAGLLFIPDGEEQDSFRPLGGFQATDHIHTLPIEIYYSALADVTRNTGFDALLSILDTLLAADPTLGGNVTGLDWLRPDTETIGGDGTAPFKTGVVNVTFTYTTSTPLT